MKRSRLKRVGPITQKWIETRKFWITQNPPPYTCGICHLPVPPDEMVLDHILSRSRRPDLRFDLTNLQPAHWRCNTEKGSQ